ncbi:MAG: hypothetical protein WBG18_18480 [Xanthobacteraceae bacterium]
MGFNRRKMEDQRRTVAEKEAAARRASDAQVLEDAERLIAVWNERQAKRMPMLFIPTIGAALAARHWFLWVYCPACRNAETPWTKELWIYDFRTNKSFTLKERPLKRADLDEFVSCYAAVDRQKRVESERFRRFDYDALTKAR